MDTINQDMILELPSVRKHVEPDTQVPANAASGRDPNVTSTTQMGETLFDFDDCDDGGIWGWSTVFGAWLINFCMLGSMSSFGATATYYATNFLSNYTSSEINWIGSSQIMVQYLFGLVAGKLLDHGYFRSLAVVGCLIFLFSTFMLSLAQPQQYYQVLLTQSIGLGIGCGLIYAPAAGVVARHFRKKWRNLALGIITTGDSLGGFFFATLYGHFLNGSIGFANGIRIGAYICTGCLFVAILLIKPYPRRPFRPSSEFDEIRKGVKCLDMVAEKPSQSTLPSIAIASTTAASSFRRPTIRSILKQPSYTLVLLYGALYNLGLYYPLFSIQLFAEFHNINSSLTPWLLSIINLSSSFGRILPSWASDKLGRTSPITISIGSAAVSGALVLLLILCRNAASIVTFCLLYGFFSGAGFSLFYPVVLALNPDVRTAGLRLGLSGPPTGLASMLGSPVAAALVGRNQNWLGGCMFAGIMQLSSAVVLWVAYILRNHDAGTSISVQPGAKREPTSASETSP